LTTLKHYIAQTSKHVETRNITSVKITAVVKTAVSGVEPVIHGLVVMARVKFRNTMRPVTVRDCSKLLN